MQKLIVQEKFNPPGDDVLALIENGMDFLDKARSELEANEYKYSIVSFWTAVEIMLKVPLLHEHWSLVCSGKRFVRSKFLEGDFQSVTYDDAITRLEDVLNMPLPSETKKAFNIIRQHRNQVVHFYKPAFTEKDQQTILSEQAAAWFALNRFMREDWVSIFGPLHSWKLARSETLLLQGNKFYSAIRLEQVKADLDKRVAGGQIVQRCDDCNQDAAVTDTIDTGHHELPVLYERHCLVCSSLSGFIRMHCPACGDEMACLQGEFSVRCNKCGVNHNRYDVLDESLFHSNWDDEFLPAGCTQCMRPGTVAKFGNGYLCTECLSFFKTLMVCECCNHAIDSVQELSYIRGCDFCDGDKRYMDE